MTANASSKFAAKLLFQIRFEGEQRNAYRMVEERIILLNAKNANSAYSSFKEIGRSENRTSVNDDGRRYFFEFIGVIDMVHLGIECQENEVWYAIKKLKTPMERKSELVPKKESLDAFKYEKKLIRPAAR